MWREYERWILQYPPSYIECPSNASLAITVVGRSEQGKFNQSIKQAKLR